MNKLWLTINGANVEGHLSPISVLNPADETIIYEAPQASIEQLNLAVNGAVNAFKTWSTLSQEVRDVYINKIADTIEENADQLAKIIVKEQGKPLQLAHMEVAGAVAWTRYTTNIEIPVEVYQETDDKRIEGRRKPIGVIGSITPWNWPLMIAIWHIIPALRMGNTVISKPSELTPINTLRLGELLQGVLPAGVFSVVCGDGKIGQAMSEHEKINKIVFTGSTLSGQRIMKSAANNLKRLTLELGGNDAAIILPNANLNKLAESIFNAAFINMGQTCAAIKRIYVHQSQHDQLCDLLTEIANKNIVGAGLLAETTFGPVQNKNQLEKVISLVEDARLHGASILTGGNRLKTPGYFYPPTIVGNAKHGMRIVDEEQFGPTVPVIKYTDVEDAIQQANSLDVGLGGSIWGDLDLSRQLSTKLECGTVWINGHAEILPHVPFGGCKMSGFGVEFGLEGLIQNSLLQVVNINKS